MRKLDQYLELKNNITKIYTLLHNSGIYYYENINPEKTNIMSVLSDIYTYLNKK